jgi:hypothetical protein
MNTESMQPAPTITSSLVIAAARLPWPTRSAWSFRPREGGASRIHACAVRRRDSVQWDDEAVRVDGQATAIRAAVRAGLAEPVNVGMHRRAELRAR